MLTPVELATGIVFGGTPSPLPEPGHSPAEALEAAVRPAVESGRTFVSFSGGRDSSAVLAAAAHVARREGHAPPVPVTIRASAAPQSHESDWQETVVRHLGLADWIRVEVAEELDAVGPYACAALARHGLLWPFNTHFHAPILEYAAGATVLTGIGGDELWASACARTVRRRRRVLQLAPSGVRREVLARRTPVEFPWLTPRGRRAAQRAAGADEAPLPRTVRERMALTRGVRYSAVGKASLDALAAEAGARMVHPLHDPALWSAVAAAAPPTGFARGSDTLRAVAGRLLPAELVSRRTKAGFDAVFFNAHARAFARDWDGTGVPTDIVSVEALRAHWAGEAPDPHTLTLMQAAWLASAGDRADEPVGRFAE